jgi:hypothetical protein
MVYFFFLVFAFPDAACLFGISGEAGVSAAGAVMELT